MGVFPQFFFSYFNSHKRIWNANSLFILLYDDRYLISMDANWTIFHSINFIGSYFIHGEANAVCLSCLNWNFVLKRLKIAEIPLKILRFDVTARVGTDSTKCNCIIRRNFSESPEDSFFRCYEFSRAIWGVVSASLPVLLE